ncbi:hypothetical protein BDV10DRAFT_196766 [Aspergillus recurvatus]
MADNSRPRPPPNRRRDKVQLSCDPCRHRKLRCDRHNPCGACSRRGLASSCNYATSSTPHAQRPVAPRQSTNVHGRITELESLVITLTKGQSPAAPPTPISPFANVLAEDASPADPGTLKLRESGTSYVQSAHWEAILTKIRGLKEDLVSDSKPPPTAVPPCSVVDCLITLYFDSYIGRAELLRAEYLIIKKAFQEKAVQCLVLARYTTGGLYILETLITLLIREFILLKDSATDGWLLIDMILHITTRMGYHRDPDYFLGISPFKAEIRRRVWATILSLDLGILIKMGLPRSVTDTYINTKEPRNLRDCDYDEDMIKMPPPRPETEWMTVLPLIARKQLVSALGLICNINTDIKPPFYKEVIKINALLKDVHKRAIPPILCWDMSMSHPPIMDSPVHVMHRTQAQEQDRDRDRELVRICLASALKILLFQQMLYREWKVMHLFNQDVLLATSVLCLYLQDTGRACSARAEEISTTSASAEAGKVAKALSIVLGKIKIEAFPAAEDRSYDFLSDFQFNAIPPLNGFSTTYQVNNEFLPTGFYSPLSFFDNVLETGGGGA